jgi:hypothetical protein
MPLPTMVRMRQTFPRPRVEDLDAALAAEWWKEGIGASVRPGMEVAITAGSRGVARIDEIIAALVRLVRDAGASPFIVPAMGSHGGATAEGQVEILRSLGVTEEACGAPIRSSMEVAELGRTPGGVPVYMDRNAHGADGVILVNRIKAHTDFRGRVESGLMKMSAIGLGKHKQALALHALGVTGIRDHMVEVARHVAASGKVLFGVGSVENGYEEPAILEAVRPGAFEEREAALLQEWMKLMPRLPVEDVDILVVDRIGKNFSGTGMDTNVIGRFGMAGVDDPQSPRVKYLLASDLSEESHGNATGVGLADLTTLRLFERIDWKAMNENVLTSTFLERAKVPMVRAHDREAVEAAVRCNWGVAPEDTRLVRVPNTLHLEYADVAEPLMAEAEANGAERLNGSAPLPFGPDGYLAEFGSEGESKSRHDPWGEVDGAAAEEGAVQAAR